MYFISPAIRTAGDVKYIETLYIYIYIYIYTKRLCIYIYIYIYIQSLNVFHISGD